MTKSGEFCLVINGGVNMRIHRLCMMCGTINSIEVDDSLENAINRYQKGIGYIQDIPLPANLREFIKSGYCLDCQEILFAPYEEEDAV